MKGITDLQHDKYGVKAIIHIAMGLVIFILTDMAVWFLADLFYQITKTEHSPVEAIIVPALTTAILSLIISLYISKALKLPLRDFRLRKPKNIIVWSIVAVGLPCVVSAFFIFLTPGHFSVSDYGTTEKLWTIFYSVFTYCLRAGITEELLFRGFIMRVLEIRCGKIAAVVIPSILFGAVHIFNMDNPNPADILMLLVAGISVGVMFSMIAIQSGSIWAGAIVHGVWNLIIIGGILTIGVGEPVGLFNYTLTAESKLLTGGLFGIESSFPAIIGYGAVIAIAFFLLRRTNGALSD